MTAVAPHNPDVEAALLGRLLREPAMTGQVAGTLLEPRHFFLAANRLLYGAVVEAFYADDVVDPMVIGELHAKQLAKLWSTDERSAVQRVIELAAHRGAGSPVEHAHLVKRDADYRRLLKLADELRDRVQSERESPEEIAGVLGQEALDVATSAVAATQEFVSLGEAGRRFVRQIRTAQAARAQGVELGAYFGLRAIDAFTKGLKGGELCICGGEPGAGKSSVWFKAALQFAERQSSRPNQVGALVLSLEMNEEPSNDRLASMISSVEGAGIREAKLTDAELKQIIDRWRQRMNAPLWFNYAPSLRTSQIRALVSEAVRRHNVGLVVIDHFRMFDLDRRLDNKLDEDEEKVRFLKEQIAMSLNVAVVCLAHTRKPQPGSNGRPRMEDLRGSYQVAAHSDFVGFVFRPAMYASQKQLDSGEVSKTTAEMIWPKARHGDTGAGEFYYDPTRMLITN